MYISDSACSTIWSIHWTVKLEWAAMMMPMMKCWSALNYLNFPSRTGISISSGCHCELEQYEVPVVSRLSGNAVAVWNAVTNGENSAAADDDDVYVDKDYGISRSLAEHRVNYISKFHLESSPWCSHSARGASTCSCHGLDPAVSHAAGEADTKLSSYFCKWKKTKKKN